MVKLSLYAFLIFSVLFLFFLFGLWLGAGFIEYINRLAPALSLLTNLALLVLSVLAFLVYKINSIQKEFAILRNLYLKVTEKKANEIIKEEYVNQGKFC